MEIDRTEVGGPLWKSCGSSWKFVMLVEVGRRYVGYMEAHGSFYGIFSWKLCRPTRAGVHLRGGIADHDGSAASTSEARKRQHYASPCNVSFDEWRHQLVALAVESCGHLGVEGSKFIDQLAAKRRGVEGSMAGTRVLKERLLQIVIWVITQVAVSRRVSRFNLQLRDRQEASRSLGGGGGDDRPTLMA